MFINQSTLFLSFLALLRVVVAQSTPWCLLSAIGTQSDPADLDAICGKDSSDVISIIKSTCTDSGSSQAALSAYSSTCSAAGHYSTASSVSSAGPSGTPSVNTTPGAGPSPTPTGSSYGNSSGSVPGSKSGSGSGSAPTSSPGRPLSTGGAVSSIDAGSAAAFAAALFVGLVAIL